MRVALLVVVALATACGARTPLELATVTDAGSDDGAQDACACVEAENDASPVDVTIADVSPALDASLDAGNDSSPIDAADEADAKICVPATCATLGAGGYDCGYAADGCGGLLQCGGCVAPQCCGGGGFDVCGGTGGCVPRTCAEQGLDCGPTGDGCGGLLQCGTCVAPQTCGGGGIMGRCGAPDAGCHPLTCQDQNIDCGVAGDGCGSELMCGVCMAPDTCGGGGVQGQCGVAPGPCCVRVGCAEQHIDCGPAGDGCGGVVQCGGCAAPQTCGGGGFGRCG